MGCCCFFLPFFCSSKHDVCFCGSCSELSFEKEKHDHEKKLISKNHKKNIYIEKESRIYLYKHVYKDGHLNVFTYYMHT